MRIVGYGICGPGEANRRMAATLREFARLCDDAIILLNNAGDEERRLLLEFGIPGVVDDREWGIYQHKIKEDFIKKHVTQLAPDWCLALDMDETFGKAFTRKEAEALADKGGAGYYFYVTNLYDEGYSPDWSFWNVRMWNFTIDRTFEQKALHPGLAPRMAYEYGNYAPFILKHYGLKDKADRDRKVERYKKYDPKAIYKARSYYDFLASKLVPETFDEDKIAGLVAKEVRNYKHKDIPTIMKQDTEYYYFRNPAGHIIDIPKRHYASTLAKPGFTLVSEDPVSLVDKPVQSTRVVIPEDTSVDPLTCGVCGFVAKSTFGINAHKRKHD